MSATIHASPNNVRTSVIEKLFIMFENVVAVKGFVQRKDVITVELCFVWLDAENRPSSDIIERIKVMLFTDWNVVEDYFDVAMNCTDSDALSMLTKSFIVLKYPGNDPEMSDEEVLNVGGVRNAEVKSRGSLDSVNLLSKK